MCGIAGIVDKSNPEAIRRMVGAMRHRGPDDQGFYNNDGQVSLGMARLAILDLSPAGHQPMCTPDGRYWIVYNGEVYNFHEQRRRLEAKGVVFRSDCDTEVVLQLYQESGEACLQRMRGMFAFAIWDRERQQLFVARDRLGIKPLYFTWQGQTFLFASELKSLLASNLIERVIDPFGLRLLLTFGSVQAPSTMVKGVQALLPGHYLIVENGKSDIKQYWELDQTPQSEQVLNYEESVRELRALLTESVRLCLISDVPLGAFLSGGVDSGAIVGLMAEAGMSHVKTFSIGFDAQGQEIDESGEADLPARHFGTDHTKLVVTGSDVASKLKLIVQALDQPSIDGLNSYFVAQMARSQVTVALSGLGGDELFAGYPHFWRLADRFNGHQSGWKESIKHALSTVAHSWVGERLRDVSLGRYVDWAMIQSGFLASYATSRTIFTPTQQQALLNQAWSETVKATLSPSELLERFDDQRLSNAIQRVSRLELKTYMPFTLLRDMDAMSMAHSLEVRVPLIDHKVVEFAAKLPAAFKYQPTGTALQFREWGASYRQLGAKRILIDAVRDLMPPGFEDRPKSGFGMPYANWLRSDLWPFVETYISEERLKNHPYLRWQVVKGIRDSFIQGRSGWVQLWALLVSEMWRELVLEG